MKLVIWIFSLLVLLFAVGSAYFLVRERSAMAADQASHAKSVFLAQMSHEIRTPINAILGMNEMIMRESHEAGVRAYARRAHDAGQSLLGLVNDILDMSKIEAGKMELVPVEFRLADMLMRIHTLISLRAEKKGLAFTITVDPQLPSVFYGDVGRLQQSIVNLLTNAVKYTQRGSVSLSVLQSAPDTWPPGVQAGPGSIMLAVQVQDTGIGIRHKDLNKLFGDFVRVDRQRNRNVEGTGLGLALTRRFIMRMGGTVTVASTYVQGSTFTAWVPLELRSAAVIGEFDVRHYREVEEAHHATFLAPQARILVVDDNEMNRFVAQSLLKETQAKIALAESGKACLSCLREQHYDLVLLDDMMPELSGSAYIF